MTFKETSMHGDLVLREDFNPMAESIFKSFARALDQATSFEPRLGGAVPSTKGLP
jgi:imidazoleglycerol-phosphate dehydratase